ncbi:MAG: ABC transporter substrate-binding protein [Burkholderiales bacterium]|nr:ABC transporter substrate-binding protein [Burkholderiales bacterium]MCE7877840.1 heme-binding protein [Betaproteobacteria bacterium PRO3]
MTRIVLALARRAFAILIAAAAAPALAAPDMNKVIREVFPAAESGFDPAAVHDLYSGTLVQGIFETLYTYDYLARPSKLVPLTADAMPEVTDEGRTWTIRLKKGIRFADDPVFGGKPRELVAEDYVYSLKRLIDPKIRSPWAFLVEGKIVGLDEIAAKAKASGRFDYDAKVPGLEAVDRYTIRIRLEATDYNLPYILAHEPSAAVAREVIAKYAEVDGRAQANPVGTGPYRLVRWVRSSKIVLEANPHYRGFTWNFSSTDPADAQLIREMKGKSMPAVGRVEVSIIEEDQARLLAFQNGEVDLMNMEGPLAPKVLDGATLRPEMKAKGVKLSRLIDPEISYTYWNMQDPVVGGLSKEKVALRRAMAMSYDVAEEIKVIRNGQAIEAKYPIPPGVVGHESAWKPGIVHDPAGANALLDRFGYKRGADGWRTLPDGKPLTVRLSSRPDTLGRQQDEIWKKSLDAIGVRMDVHKDKFPELLKAEKQCKLQMRVAAWIADYPDGDNFMQLLYGPNTFQSNNACAKMPEFDRLYEKSVKLPPGPERDALYRDMTKVMEAYAPWRLTVSRYRNMLAQPWVLGYRRHPILHAHWKFVDVDAAAKGK